MQDVSDKLLGQFVACLETRLAGPRTPSPPASPAPSTPASTTAPADQPSSPTPQPAAGGPEASATPRRTPEAPAKDDAIDLGATVLPVLVKSYWKQGLGVLVVVALVIWWVTRG